MADSFDGLKKAMEIMMNSLKETGEEVNTTEVKQVEELLQKYDVVLNNDTDEKDLILKYETFYDQLNEFIIDKGKQIVDVEKMINTISGITDGSQFSTILNKKKDNTNQIIDCDNRIVERIRKLETTIYENRMKELDNMRVERYGESKQKIIKVSDNEMNIINNSISLLQKWSNRAKFNVIFDSKVNRDGVDEVLQKQVINKNNLYFITSDQNNNLFGGYVNGTINKANNWILDDRAFVFSLIRNGSVKNTKYSIRPGMLAFNLHYDDFSNKLYSFGDIDVSQIGYISSCQYDYYDYGKENNPFIDDTFYDQFRAKRIIVIQMRQY